MIRKIICYTVLLSDSGCKNKMLCYVMSCLFCRGNVRLHFHIELCAGRAAAADNLWAPPPPTFVDRRDAAADNLLARRRYHCCCVVIFWEFLITSSLSSLPSGRSKPPMVSCFSMLSFFFKFAVFLAHHPVQ